MNNNPFLREKENRNAEVIRLGTVQTVDGNNWTIKWDDAPDALNTTYSRVDTYTPAVGDRVIGVQRAQTYVILGKLVH